MKIYGYLLAFVTLFFLSLHGVGGRFLTTNEGLNPFVIVFLNLIPINFPTYFSSKMIF